MRRLLFVAAILCSLFTATMYANDAKRTDATISGHVVDAKTHEHLAYVSVVLQGTTVGGITDASGHYMLKDLPAGKYNLVASAVGYRSVSKPVVIKNGVNLNVNFDLEEDLISLDGVVVTANRAETTRRLAPTLVSVMDNKLFEKTSSTTLSQTLNFQPGVRMENNCQNCGFSQVRINGLDGPYTQILIDSRPIFGALAGVYGLEQIPTNMIDRVEVMRGGGSALFGSSAIAGTINIIIKEPVRNSASVSHTISAFDAKNHAFDNYTTMNASMITDNRKAGVFVYGSNRHRDPVDVDGDKYSDLPILNSQAVGFRSFLKTSDFSKLTAEYHHLQEFRRGGDQIFRPAHEARIAEQIQHSINSGSLKYDLNSADMKHRLSIYTSAQSINRNSYYGGIGGDDDEIPSAADSAKARKNYGSTDDITWMAGGQYIYHFDKCLFMPSDLTLGTEYTYDNLKDEMWDRNHHVNQTTRMASAFFQNEWKNDMWSILVGGRFDKHNLVNHVIFSPRLNVRFNPIKDINIRASYAEGFRAPQIFDEDLHVESVNGIIKKIFNSTDLKEERSRSLSLSADMYHCWGPWQANLMVEGFYTRLSNVFNAEDEYKVGDKDVNMKDINNFKGQNIYIRRNRDGANVYGGVLEGKIAYLNKVQLQAGLTVQRAHYLDPEERIVKYNPAKEATPQAEAEKENKVIESKQIIRTPDTYGYFTLTVNPVKKLSLVLSGVYTGNMYVLHSLPRTEPADGWGDTPDEDQNYDLYVKTPKFMEVGFKASYDFKIYKEVNLQVNAGVKNIFNSFQSDLDQGASRDSGYIYGPAMPRCYYAGVKMSF